MQKIDALWFSIVIVTLLLQSTIEKTNSIKYIQTLTTGVDLIRLGDNQEISFKLCSTFMLFDVIDGRLMAF